MKPPLIIITLVAAAIALAAYLSGEQIMKSIDKKATQPRDPNFDPSEFRGWFNKMNPSLLLKLYAFRRALGFPVTISPNSAAIGRTSGSVTSGHYYSGPGDTVDAIDVLPNWPNGGTQAEVDRAYQIAQQVGFAGIGIGGIWKPRPGLHLDVMPRHASWGYTRNQAGNSTANITADQAITRLS